MEQSDLYLLQHVPPYHLQALSKARNIPLPSAAQSASSSGDLSPALRQELGERLFDPAACREVIRTLDKADLSVLQELTSCGGRANSRDLALYLSSAGLLSAGKARQDAAHVAHTPLPASSASLADHMRVHTLQYPAPHPHGAFEQVVHRLLALGLLFWGKQTSFSGRDYANGVYDGVLIVPQTVMDVMQSLDAEHEQHSVQQESLPAIFGEGLYELQRSLYLYWSLVSAQRDGLPLVASKLLSRPALRQVVEQLTTLNVEQIRIEADVPRLLFLRLLLMSLGLLYERNGAIGSAKPASAEAYFALPLAERARRCYQVWLETPFWNELNYLPGVILRPAPGPVDPAHAGVVRARMMLMDRVLSLAQPGTRYPLTSFIARAKLHIPYLLFPRESGARSERYSIGSNPYGVDFRLKQGWLTHREGWYLVEGGFIRAVLTGPLRWLGLVELDEDADTFTLLPALTGNYVMLSESAGALSAEKGKHLSSTAEVRHPSSTAGLSHVMLSESAEALSAEKGKHLSSITDVSDPSHEDDEHSPTALKETWGRLIVQPNFELVALAPVSEALLLRLDRFAERVRLEQIAQYRLTRASVTRAVQEGMPAEEILRVLEQAAGGAIPQNVYYSLKEWERHARRVELWPRMTLIEVEDEPLLDAFYADDGLRPLLGRRLAPTLAEVPADQLETFQALLWQREYLPALAAAPAYTNLLESGGRVPVSMPAHEAQWRLLEHGLLEPCYPVLNLYLAAELERFTVLDRPTGWQRITPDSIRRACDDGLALDAIIRFLQRYCEGGLPASFLIRLKMWGGGYQQQERIQLEAAPLLRLSLAALRDIQADEELGALLDAEVPPDSRLVRVPPQSLARVLDLLRERGFTVEEP